MGDVVRIRLIDSSLNEALRDYFRRLGAEASIAPDGTVAVAFGEGDNAGVEEYLGSWMAKNLPEPEAASVEPSAEARPRFEILPRLPSPTGQPLRLGDLLVSKGMITSEQLSQALVESRAEGELVGLILLRHGWVFENELARVLAEQWNLPYLDLSVLGAERAAARLLPPEVGLRFAAVPVRLVGGRVQVAFADPSDPAALEAVREHIPECDPAVAELRDIRTLWDRMGG